MSVIQWDDATLSIGIESIDNQHKVIIECINELSKSIQKSEPISVLDNHFEILISYTKYHFASEETYFKCLNEKEVQLHKLHHKHFIEQLYIYKKQVHQDITQDILDSLLDWFIGHIQCEDMKLIQNIKK